ncbi:MAG: class I SAM-dependent RNA methyltransferase, partial [Gemmatimonadota bacterium]|nr:class I SAM-dependent RNA methyltransferase [Gemmatimonadota bacterium]
MTGETVDLTVHGIALGGSGVGRTESGQVVFVPGSVPGDRVRVELTERRKRWARGRILELYERGPGRVEPTCGVFTMCGGCTLMHLDDQRQLEALRQGVADALSRIGKVDVPVSPVIAGDRRLAYRNRVTFTLRRRGGRVFAGYHAASGGRVIDVVECPLAEPAINLAWRGLRAAWGPGAVRLPDGGEIRLTLRASGEGRVGLFVAGGRGGEAAADASRGVDAEARRLLRAVPEMAGYWWRPAEGERRLLAGDANLTDTWQGVLLELGPEAFVQVNREVADLIEAHLDAGLGDLAERTIVDLYGGVGLRGIRWAERGARAVTVESNSDAVQTGREAAARVGSVCEFVKGRVEAALEGGVDTGADTLVVNPPRTGLSPEAAELLCREGARRLVYVSCDPATLARDVARLSGSWIPRSAQPFDAFPQTGHVETV